MSELFVVSSFDEFAISTIGGRKGAVVIFLLSTVENVPILSSAIVGGEGGERNSMVHIKLLHSGIDSLSNGPIGYYNG